MNHSFLVPAIPPTRWGIRYLLFELLFAPLLLTQLNAALGYPLTAAWLNLVYYCLNFGAVAVIFRKFIAATFRDAPGKLSRILGFALLGYGIYWGVALVQGLLVHALVPDFVNINDASIQAQLREAFWPYALATVLLVPVAEELLFRGALFGGLYRYAPKAAWILSVAVFAFVHINPYLFSHSADVLLLCALQYIPAGILLAWVYRSSGSILTPILIHGSINALGLVIMR